MADNNYVKAKHLFILTVFLLFLYSCASGSGMISDRDKSKLDFQIPELLQQEIPAENTIDLEEYSLYNSILENGPIIPGLFQGTVPQGMAYNEEADLMLISNYMYDTRPSCITAISMA
ncbi:MAG: hypothetical protein KAH14_07045, partial [Clostridiales bacterium]|nr:hypothetical protein [Clostridiales bacterium]